MLGRKGKPCLLCHRQPVDIRPQCDRVSFLRSDKSTDACRLQRMRCDAQLSQMPADPLRSLRLCETKLRYPVKFPPERGPIRVRMYRQEDSAVVTVTDSGCGMDRETLRHIFDKFYQGDTSHATQGNGLGLALAKRIVDLLDGAISVQSIPGKGSEFAVTFSIE